MPSSLQTKDQQLAHWMAELQNEHLRLSDPETYRIVMEWTTSRLQDSGLFDQMEVYDLQLRYQGAYTAALEEQFAHDVYCRASDYNVVPEGSPRRIAHITHGNYYEDGKTSHFLFDGRVVTKGGRISIEAYGGAREIGVIEGTLLITPGGVFNLIETGRSCPTGKLEGVADPDAYRALLDVAQATFEMKEWRLYRVLRDRIRYSPFTCCPKCGDRFGRQDDCDECQSLGFIPRNMGNPA